MIIYYWSPCFSKIATTKAVFNSYQAINKKKNVKAYIINSVGEWDTIKSTYTVNFIKSRFFYKILPKRGFFFSRIFAVYVFFASYKKMKKIFNEKKRNIVIIAHLITSLPILLNYFFFNKKVKLILRISGYPKMNFFRKFIWKKFLKKAFLVTSPTQETLNRLVKKKIIKKNKIKLLRDPVIPKILSLNKKNFNRLNFLSIGRFTEQKNFNFLITSMIRLDKEGLDFKLKILGDGEEFHKLKKLVKENNLSHKIILLGYKKNVEKFYKSSDCLLITSKWEDPGFVMIEAASFGLPIISSDCPSGPKEILDNGKLGFLYQTNNFLDFRSQIYNFKKCNDKKLLLMTQNLNKKLNLFSQKYHSNVLYKLIKC